MSAALLVAAEPLDVCTCGDYRRDHPELGCLECAGSGEDWRTCARFELWAPVGMTEDLWGTDG